MKSTAGHCIRVAVVESDPVRYLGLHAILSSDPDIQVRSATVRAVVKDQKDDVVLVAIDRGGVFDEAMLEMKAAYPGIRIIVTGPASQDEDILRVVFAGAKGYIAEEASPQEFKKALREVHAGSVWLPRRILAMFIEQATFSVRRAKPSKEARISQREREVLQLLVVGRSNQEIARELGIIEGTVKAHIAQLLRKVGVTNRTALSVHAVTHSLLQSRQ
jgi:DNA-binding NarL/FixJ family response regulator